MCSHEPIGSQQRQRHLVRTRGRPRWKQRLTSVSSLRTSPTSPLPASIVSVPFICSVLTHASISTHPLKRETTILKVKQM
ncbi:hypothetical protein AB205_0122310 [Aquarana catesbeiana]|uniref:Uncharacterized protein n=1 Tax=Aquarana catesbeiana TaxID=8400 RepID=A0A2G9S7T0_AQUCT|nr:hypothetical protein AB205_0122310 [Aquarana catesbeiana]